ncbi:MAG: NTP transferase domain-containing protein [Phycisphaerales bacterium]|nr:NTP transferase domain-containing protein [Phycisphaerales bacterium]
MGQPRIGAIILAAGKGTRLKSELPKVLHPILGRPMLAYVFDACREAGVEALIGVVGHGRDQVVDAFSDATDVQWVDQTEQLGTGHAAMVCRDAFKDRFDHVFVLCGDGPLIRAETLATVLKRHLSEGMAGTLATAELEDATGYGRITRDAKGALTGIVEHRDCTPAQLKIREVNPSYYCFSVPEFLVALGQLKPNNVKNEYYITDCIGLMLGAGHKVDAITAVPPDDIYSINSRRDLALVNRVMRDRINARWMDNGVTIVDPQTTWIDARATIGVDTVIEPFSVIMGAARIGRECHIGPFARLDGDEIADGSRVVGAAGALA